jgi:hypothetical protein
MGKVHFMHTGVCVVFGRSQTTKCTLPVHFRAQRSGFHTNGFHSNLSFQNALTSFVAHNSYINDLDLCNGKKLKTDLCYLSCWRLPRKSNSGAPPRTLSVKFNVLIINGTVKNRATLSVISKNRVGTMLKCQALVMNLNQFFIIKLYFQCDICKCASSPGWLLKYLSLNCDFPNSRIDILDILVAWSLIH